MSKYRTIAPRLLRASDTMFLSTGQYITLFYVCFCLKIPCLIYTVNSLTLSPQPRAVTHTEQSLPNTCIFSGRHITAFLRSGTLGSTSALCLGAIFNRKISNKKHPNGKNMALNRPWKGYYLQEETWNQKAGRLLVQPGNVCIWQLKVFISLRMSVSDRESTVSTAFGITITF